MWVKFDDVQMGVSPYICYEHTNDMRSLASHDVFKWV